jgi:predicted HTH transcriptional regulator
MNTIELLELISKGEGHHLEFKREEENNSDFAKTIVAFANTDGGKILIGVDDNGNIVGVENTEKTMRRLDDIAFNRCNPPITILQEVFILDNKQLVVVSVPKGIQRPYMTNPTIYNLLYKFKLVTDLGSGIKRACDLIKKYTNKDVEFNLTDNEFVIIVPRNG